MYKQTNAHYKDITNDVRNYIDHIARNSTRLEDQEVRIKLDDKNRQLHHYVRLFRNHAERDDFETSLIMLAMTRNNIYKYVARALLAGVDFDISQAANLLARIENYSYTQRVMQSIKE